MDWEEDAETTYQHRPGADFSPAPRLNFGDQAWDPEPPARFTHPASGEWVLQPVRLPANEFGSEFGYRRKRRSGVRWLWFLLTCALVLATIPLARLPQFQPVADTLSAVADRLGLDEALARFAPNFLTRTPVRGPAADSSAQTSAMPAPSASVTPAVAAEPAQAAPSVPNTTATAEPTNAAPSPAPRRTRPLRRPARQPAEPAVASEPPSPSPIEPSDDEPPSPTADGDSGVLSINSLPWSEVSIDGSWVGTTPQREIKLRPGRHKIKLVNPDLKLVRMFSVHIKAGETLTKSVVLQP